MNEKKLKSFLDFLQKSGANVMEVTNCWEVVRFKTKQGTSIIYKNKAGKQTYVGEALTALNAFQNPKIEWNPNKVPRKQKQIKSIKTVISERDGLNCFYCSQSFEKLTDLTVEHFLNVSHGGNNHPSNLTLACHRCNIIAGNLPIVDKFKLKGNL